MSRTFGSIINAMMAAVAPQEDGFFDLFDAHAKCLIDASRRLADLTLAPEAEFAGHFAAIREAEGRADQCARSIFLKLHKSFITPLDRLEVKDLVVALDNVVDCIEAIPMRSSMYGPGPFTKEMAALSQILLRAAERVAEAVGLLRDMSNAGRIMAICEDIGAIESESDKTMRDGMTQLFAVAGEDIRMLIRTKELYELFEEAVDRCEDVADVIHGIVLERV